MTVEFSRGKAYVVDRGKPKLRAGQGMLAGLDVVIKHFASAFTKKIENPSETQGVFTVQYPEERLALPEAFRNFPILLYDDATGHELCTSCFQCERICPPQVIHMTQANDPVTGKPVPAVEEFIIEYDACMSCGLCAEVCPFDAIKMDHEFELATDDHGSMTVNKAGLDRPVSYYATLAPTMWAEVKDGAYKKLQGNMKRRSGNIGIAPTAKVKPAAPTAARPASAATAASAAAKPAASASSGQSAPVAAVGKNMSEDKAARLAAIRAANAAKTGGAAPPAPAAAEAPSAPESAAPAAPMATAAPEAPAPEAPSAPVAAVGKNMSEDKAARLAAIRAANAAKKNDG
jgi:formate hydrogenlyase subunit 6/NADH:ubiquinone oxidoreductase subunit I